MWSLPSLMKSSVSRAICEKIKPQINNPSSNNFPLVYKKCLYYYAPNVTKTVGPIWRKKINSICTSTSPKLSYNLIKTNNNFLLRRHKFLLHFADMASYSVFLTYRPDSKLNKQSRDLMRCQPSLVTIHEAKNFRLNNKFTRLQNTYFSTFSIWIQGIKFSRYNTKCNRIWHHLDGKMWWNCRQCARITSLRMQGVMFNNITCHISCTVGWTCGQLLNSVTFHLLLLLPTPVVGSNHLQTKELWHTAIVVPRTSRVDFNFGK